MSVIQKPLENRKEQAQNFTGTKSAIEKRRERVYFLNLQGFTNTEIAKELDVSLSTIEKDLHYMKFYCIKWAKDILENGQKKPLVDICSQIDLAQGELWKMYRAEKDVNTKKRLLDTIVANSIKKQKELKYKMVTHEEEQLLEKTNLDSLA